MSKDLYNKIIDEAFRLKSEVSTIDHQIEMAGIEADEKNIPMDRTWLAKAKYAKQKKNQEANSLQAKAGRIKRDLNLRKADAMSNHFMDIARVKLDKEKFEEIVDMARDLYNAGENNNG